MDAKLSFRRTVIARSHKPSILWWDGRDARRHSREGRNPDWTPDRRNCLKTRFWARDLPENVLQGEKFENSETTMGKQIRADYEQILMFPPSVEDWVGKDHPARFIRDFVDSLDLSELGIEIPDSDTGRPPYAPDLLLKVWLYGYFNRIRASRKLEKACLENMGLIWLTGMNAPDHNSLWRFFKANKKSLRHLFKQSIRVALKADLIGLVLHAVDGTKIRTLSANEHVRDRKHLERVLEDISERLDRTIGDAMTEMERAEREESGEYRLPASMQDGLKRKQRIQEALKELDASDKKVVHPSEPEARFMKNRRTKDLSYNAQAVADEKSGLIVAQDVVTDGVDNGQLVPMLDKVKENLGAVAEETVADGGYFSSGQIGLADERKYEVLVAKVFRRDRFRERSGERPLSPLPVRL